MFHTVGTIKLIIGNDIWINPSPRYSFASHMANANFIILDNNDEHLIKMISASTSFKLNVIQEDIAILKHLSGDRQLGFNIDDNLKDIKTVLFTDE